MKATQLGHTVLYAKGWYRKSDNRYDDLRATLGADGYSTEFFTDKDIVRCLLYMFEKCKFDSASCELSNFVMSVIGDSEEETYDKIIVQILSKFRFLGKNDWNHGAPDYNKVLPLSGDQTLDGVREMFADFNK